MTFKVLIHPKALNDISQSRRDQIKEALKELNDPFPGGNKSKIEGYKEDIYRLRIGNYRAMYRFDVKKAEVYVYEILTAEQAHKKYDRLV
jgi:mRNA-degrading endonuclease RelE of RelBE toxin-antitoxin system